MAHKEWYDKMGTEEGERMIFYKVANAREQLGEVPAVEGPVQEISREEVNTAIESMKKG